MKQWPDDHPKAKLMARKREAIVTAATEAFLRLGYGGASMEGIAANAGVSIMTLYRHAEGKDDLFAAVIASACHPADQADQASIGAMLQQSLSEILIFVGIMFQRRLASGTTTALLRAVMMETQRFPHLADLAYQGLIGTHEDKLASFLDERPEAASLAPDRRRALCTAFLSRLVGTDFIRVLLGQDGPDDSERLNRAKAATLEFLGALGGKKVASSVKP